MIAARSLCVVVALLGSSCTRQERVVVLHPTRGSGARDLVRLAFMQQVTPVDNFVRRPDEFAAVAVDHARSLLYVGSREGSLLALDRNDGAIQWEVVIGGAVSSRPMLTHLDEATGRYGDLILGTDNGELLDLDLESREPRWRYRTDGTIRNEALEREGVIFFANSRDQIFALDARTGEWRWQYEQEFQTDFTVHGRAGLTLMENDPSQPGLVGSAEPAVLFTGFDNGKVAAIGAGTGEALWLSSVAPADGGDFIDCDSTPFIDVARGEVIVSGQSTGVHSFVLSDGSLRWKFPVRGAGSVVGERGRTRFVASSLEGVFALDVEGGLEWNVQLDPGVVSDPVLVSDVVYVTHSEQGLLAFDANTGDFLAQVDPGSGMSSVPVYDPFDRRFYATSNRGMLVALNVVEDDLLFTE